MSDYQVLARKYRPKDFSQLLGQSHVWQALSHAIDTGRVHHAYLFTGTRGVGKTTIARILAKCLNCETGMTSTPCGMCDTCVSVDSGRFIDLIEIDAASRTKVEDTRDLLENVPYAPTQGRYKVYLIDEVHMLSTHSFNALLKTLEEPPEHVKFILATTDPQKLPVTIVSRCLQFVLRPMPQELLHGHLSKILQAEQIPFEDTALWQLAKSAKGSVRDALSLTDQAIAFGGGQVKADTVTDMLGLVDSLDVLDLIDDIYHDNRPNVARHITRLRSQVVDATAMLDRLVDSFHTMALVQILPNAPLDMNDDECQAFMNLAQAIPSDVIQLYYEIAIKARDSVRLATTPMQALEMGILRLLAFRPLATHEMAIYDSTSNHHQNTNDITHENLTHENLTHENLTHENLTHENLTHENLTHENLTHENLTHENLTHENLTHENLTHENLTHENLTHENLTHENLTHENLTHENLTHENLTHENSVSVNTEISENPPQQSSTLKPTEQNLSQKEQLKQQLIAPEVEITGTWTPQKWDYWVAQARQNGWLTTDELALVSHGLMMGETAGQCQLYIMGENKQATLSFQGFSQKFAHLMPNAILLGYEILGNAERQAIPSVRQNERKKNVDMKIEQGLLQSPVLTKLHQMGYLDKTGPIVGTVMSFLDG